MRIVLAVLAGVVMAATATGCGTAPAGQSGPAGQSAAVAGAVRGVAAVEPGADPRPLGAADTEFGLAVMRAWCAQDPRRNLVFSPSILASALGLAYLGARGSTARAMARTLDLPVSGTQTPALAAQLQARWKALSALDGPGVTLAAVSQVWADSTYTTRRGYLNAVATGYDAGLDQAPCGVGHAIRPQQHNQRVIHPGRSAAGQRAVHERRRLPVRRGGRLDRGLAPLPGRQAVHDRAAAAAGLGFLRPADHGRPALDDRRSRPGRRRR